MNGPADSLANTMSTEMAVLQAAEEALRSGNDLLCNDLVHNAAQRGIRSPRLDYLRVVSLANAGSTALALRQHEKACAGRAELDEDWLTLRGRLERDLAFSGRAGPHRHFLQAAQAYVAAYQRFGGYSSAINAASMLFLAGHTRKARQLAQQTLDLIQRSVPQDETELFLLHLTDAEAALLLGDLPRLESQLKNADALLQGDVARRSRSVRQLRRLCRALKVDPAVVRALRLPPVILLRRIGPLCPDWADACDAPPALPPGSLVFCGVRDAVDLRIAERLQEAGMRSHLALPQQPAAMLAQWRERHGPEGEQRLDACIGNAERVSVCRGFLEQESGWSAHHLTATTLGLSLLSAGRLSDLWRMIDVDWRDGRVVYVPLPEIENLESREQLALAQAGYASPRATAGPQGRRMVGLIFADFAGFNRIGDGDLPRYWSEIMAAIAQVIRKYDGVLLRQTWGDALHVVTADALTAAQLAVDIQDYIELRKLKQDGALARLELRLAAHFAPAFTGQDPIGENPTYFGSQLSFTARIEPVVPPGMIYVSEAFAARLALEAPRRFALEYAGDLELAKRFGRFQLYSLRRR